MAGGWRAPDQFLVERDRYRRRSTQLLQKLRAFLNWLFDRVHGKLRQLFELIHCIVGFEGSVSIQAYGNVVAEIFSPDILKDVALFFKIKTTHLQLDASKAVADLDLYLLKHEVHASHPDQSIDRYGVAIVE